MSPSPKSREDRYIHRLNQLATVANATRLPKLVCKPRSSKDTLKVGIFGGLHGDEPAGSLASYEFAKWAWNDPVELQDYEVHIYPICNPTGIRMGTRESLSGLDLNREFWMGSLEPEIQFLESELRREKYDVIIALHADDESDGTYGFVSGALLTEHVLKPALEAASAILPINRDPVIDGFLAHTGIIKEGYIGILSAPPEQNPKPLEIVFETPALAPVHLQVEASLIAIRTMLAEWRKLLAYAPNL